MKVLFRVPFTIYFLAWDEDYKLFYLVTKVFKNGIYSFRSVGEVRKDA